MAQIEKSSLALLCNSNSLVRIMSGSISKRQLNQVKLEYSGSTQESAVLGISECSRNPGSVNNEVHVQDRKPQRVTLRRENKISRGLRSEPCYSIIRTVYHELLRVAPATERLLYRARQGS